MSKEEKKKRSKLRRNEQRPERVIHDAAKGPTRDSKKDNPFTQFGKLIKDFRSGIHELYGIGKRLRETPVEGARARDYAPVQEIIWSKDTPPHPDKTQLDIRAPSHGSKLSEKLQAPRVSHVYRMHTSSLSPVRYKTVKFTPRQPSAIRVSSSPVNVERSSVSREGLGALGRYAGMSGADLEAVRHVNAPNLNPSDPAHVPSAARLSQILQADRLMSVGEITVHPQIQSWATSIREGRRREVADLDPGVVQGTLTEAVGGSSNVERLLSTPEIKVLRERHDSVLNRHRSELRSLEHRLERTLTARAASAKTARSNYVLANAASTRIAHSDQVLANAASAKIARFSLAKLSHSGYALTNTPKSTVLPRHARTHVGVPFPAHPNPVSTISRVDHLQGRRSRMDAPEPPNSYARNDVELAKHDYAAMSNMLATNEEPHLAAVTNTERERLQREIVSLNSPQAESPKQDRRAMSPQAESPKQDRRVMSTTVMPKATSNVSTPQQRQEQVTLPAAMSERKTATGITQSPSFSKQTSQAPEHKDGSGSKFNRIKGELRLVTNSGQEIGMLEMNAEM